MLMIKMFVLTKINNVTDKIKDILILINITTRRIISKYFMSFCLMSKVIHPQHQTKSKWGNTNKAQ